jgi:hypothetical protein
MHFLCLWRQSHPIVFYTDAGMIRDDLRSWNEEIKRLDRPIGQRASGLGGRLLKKNPATKQSVAIPYSTHYRSQR